MRLLFVVALGASLSACHGAGDAGFARARRIEALDDGVGGPKALARTGDFVIENDRIKVAILAARDDDGNARDSMGPGKYGGSLVDADLQWNDPRFPAGYGNDQFTEMFATVNMNVTAPDPADPDDVEIVGDGSDGGAAVIRTRGKGDPFLTLLGALWAIVDQPDMGLSTDYIVEPGKPWVEIKTTATIGWAPGSDPSTIAADGDPVDYSDAGMPLLDWAIASGVSMGDFYLQGGSVDVFAPEMGFDEDGAVYQAGVDGKNTIDDPFQFDFLAGTADGVSYGIAPAEGSAYVPLFTSSQTAMFGGGRAGDPDVKTRFPVGTALTYDRYFFVGHGDVGSIVDGYLDARGIAYGTVSGHVLEEATDAPVSKAMVFVYKAGHDKPWSEWTTDVDPRDDVQDGSFSGHLPPGDYELLVHKQGRPDGERVALRVDEGSDQTVALVSPRPGLLTFEVHDELGRLVPAKVTLFRDGGPARDPDLGDGRIGADKPADEPDQVVFAPYGHGEVELPDGTYTAVASRGVEYELGRSEPFTISRTSTSHLELSVEHSVDTDGWISADFHVHGQPSHDVGVTYEDRVTTMVCEGVEFFSSTDHDYLTDYAPIVEDMGLEQWVQTAVGNETTTIEIGHFLGFPLETQYLQDAHGAFDWTDHPPADIIGALRQEGQNAGYDPVVFVGHPRDGILGYFDQYGLDPYGGTPGIGAGSQGSPKISPGLLTATNPLLKPENMDFGFDALEMLNGKRMELIRTPTQPEMDEFADFYAANPNSLPPTQAVYDMLVRTMDEQEGLKNGTFQLGYGDHGQIDDWFTLLNLGFTYTVLGNSDTHDKTGVESGCPRNFVFTEDEGADGPWDDPQFLDDQAVADAVKAHHVVASYGPFVEMSIDGARIGDTVKVDGGVAHLKLDVQAPTWMSVTHAELYENGTLIQEWNVDDDGAVVDRIHEDDVELHPTKDGWYVVVVEGDQDMSPVFTTVEIPYIQLQDVVVDALGGIDAVQSFLSPAVPIPRSYPVLPYAITNPIWVDADGQDGWSAPGLPDWLKAPVDPGK